MQRPYPDLSHAYWLALPSMLISMPTPCETTDLPRSTRAAILDRWRSKSWPAVHFFPESRAGAELPVDDGYGTMLDPGACCIGSDLMSPWSSRRFSDLHHDVGSPPLIVIGGELDRSVLATAVGAAERNVPVTIVTASCACASVHGNTVSASRESVRSILRGFALECSAAQILSATAEAS